MREDSAAFLSSVEQYLRQQVAPQANRLDQDAQALSEAMMGLGDRQLLGLRVPQTWGGAGGR